MSESQSELIMTGLFHFDEDGFPYFAEAFLMELNLLISEEIGGGSEEEFYTIDYSE